VCCDALVLSVAVFVPATLAVFKQADVKSHAHDTRPRLFDCRAQNNTACADVHVAVVAPIQPGIAGRVRQAAG
jgi:hypothetical protein